jgi:hypothetical protein
MNLYAYVGNSPLMATDPTGMCGPCVLAVPFAVKAAFATAATLAVYFTADAVVQVVDLVQNAESAEPDSKIDTPTPEAGEGDSESNGPRINEGQQGKHQPGHNNHIPGRGELTHPDPQGLVDGHAGTGEQVGPTPTGEPGSKERVDFGEPIGTHVDGETGERSGTTNGIIHYGSRGVHIVPARPTPPSQ